jgi:glycosyltransferase involved in cell wall biosynthesis
MRIIVLTSSFDLGGAEKHAIKLANYFKNTCSYIVEFWVLEEGNADKTCLSLCNEYNIPTNIIGVTNRISKYLYYKQINHYLPSFKNFKPDVIISFNLIPNLINGLIGKLAGAKVLIWSQQSVNKYFPDSYIEKKIIKNISGFISNSNHGAEKIKQDFGLSHNKVFVIYNGIEYFTPKNSGNFWLKNLGISDNTFKAIMVANLTETKDHITLIKAWKIVVESLTKINIKAVLTLTGRLGNSANDIIKQVTELELIPNIIITGSVKDIDGLNSVMNLGILSSHAEGLPNSIMENMMAGLPVVGTNIAGIREVVGEDNLNFLSAINDHIELANNILKFAHNSQLRTEVGLENHQRIKEKFNVDQMMKGTEKIILGLLNH